MAKGVSIYIVNFDKINYLGAIRQLYRYGSRNWRQDDTGLETFHFSINDKCLDPCFNMGNLLTKEQFENNI
jgi:hypothetical protein